MPRVPQIALADWAPDVTAASGFARLLPVVAMLLIFFAALEIVDRVWWRPPGDKAGGTDAPGADRGPGDRETRAPDRGGEP